MNIKSTLLFMVALLGFGTAGFTQSGKLQSGDSVRIELERKSVSTELIDLRDSMALSIIAFDAKIKKSKPSKVEKLKSARKELAAYKDQLELDLKEVTQTSRNSWSKQSMERIQLSAQNTRREYKRICTLL